MAEVLGIATALPVIVPSATIPAAIPSRKAAPDLPQKTTSANPQSPVRVAGASSTDDKPRLRLRKGDEPHTTHAVTIPGLEEAVASSSTASAAEESLPVLQPIEETPVQLKIAPPTPSRPPVTPQTGSHPKPSSSIGKPQAAANAAPKADHANKPQAPCAAHPEKTATHNCMNCSKPICIECVHQHGYYCSAACKEAVRAREPKLAKGDEAAAVDEKVGRTMEKLGGFLTKLKVPAYILIALVVGYLVYMKLWGPRGRVTANLVVLAEMAAFDVKLTGPDTVVFQRNDDLCLANLSTQQELWKTDLRPLEEKYQLPKRTNIVADSSRASEDLGGYSEGGSREFRDRLRFRHLKGDNVVVHSSRQLMVFGASDGKLRWKIFNPDSSLSILAVHEGGVLCQMSPSYYASRDGTQARVVNLAFADGAEKWALPGPLGYGNRILSWNGKLVLLTSDAVTTATGVTVNSGKTKKTTSDNGGDGDEDAVAVTAPASTRTLKFLSPGEGSVLGQKALDLLPDATLDTAGKRLAIVSGNQLLLFENGIEPTLRLTLPDNPMSPSVIEDASEDDDSSGIVRSTKLVVGGNVLAIKTEKGVVALDVDSGQTMWTRADVNAENLAVGPDGSVYATVEIPKEAATKGDAEKYRIAVIAEGGFNMPNAAVTTMLKLDAKTGKTLWGVKNIGRRVLFVGKELYVVDTLSKLHLFSGSDMFAGHLSVRGISPRNGKDDWTYLAKAQLYRLQLFDRKLFLVVAEEAPAGRTNPSCNYQLRVIEKK